jgi:hypothetical protein
LVVLLDWIGGGAEQLVLFTGARFGWGAQINGLILAGVELSQSVVEGLLLQPIITRRGERQSAIAGYVAGALGYGTLALAFAGWTGPGHPRSFRSGPALPLRSQVSPRLGHSSVQLSIRKRPSLSSKVIGVKEPSSRGQRSFLPAAYART